MKAPSKNSNFILIIPALAFILLAAIQTSAQDPVVIVRFNNPVYVCATQTYSLDVEFQSNTASKEICQMNVRFFYNDDILEFLSFDGFVTGYGVMGTTTKMTGTAETGMALLGFSGPEEWVSGGVKKNVTNPKTFISTTGWTKLYRMNFHVDDPTVMEDPSFCPSVVWDKTENMETGMGVTGGVLYTVVTTFPGSANAIENVQQFNWAYDGIPGNPHGNPVETYCLSTISSYAPKTHLPTCELSEPGTTSIPVLVTNFNNVKTFALVFEYDPAVMSYVSNSPSSVFTSGNGLLNVTDSISTGGKRKIKMNFSGVNPISLADSAHLVDFNFSYIQGSAPLTWLTTGTNCYFTGPTTTLRCDLPKCDFYFDGAVSLSQAMAPTTKIDSTVAVTGDFVTYAVKVWDYTEINSGLLTLTYDPDVLDYDAVLPHSAIAEDFTVDVQTPGTIAMDWTGTDTTTLSDGSVLMYVTYQYLGGSSPLSWFDNGLSCHYYSCNSETPLDDVPLENHYINGNIANAVFVWTGENSSDWNSNTNWGNDAVPNEFIDVIIDPTTNPDNWPTFTGDFVVGENCKNLTINGDAHLVINGDLTINPGHVLELTGSGFIQVNGNWINSGIFYPGEGTVEFTGSNDANISEGVDAGNYVAAYNYDTFTPGMIQLTGGSAGPSGNDAHTAGNIGFVFNYLGIDYSIVRMNTNGWISLNQSGDDVTSNDNTSLFNTSSPSTVLAPWWDDLNADAGSTVSFKTEGTSPYRVFTIEWKNILSYSADATTRLNFQVKLFETTNVIEFCYGDVTSGTHSPDESASAGIKDATGGIGNFKEATQNSTHIIRATLKSDSNWPEYNYRFTPPVANDTDTFYKLIVSKPTGSLHIQKDVSITGLD